MIGQAGIGVLAQGENTQEAADFLAFFTNPENSAKLAQYFPPARNSQLNAETLAAANPLLTEEQLEDVVVRPSTTAWSARPTPARPRSARQVRAALDAMWVADADVAAVLADVCTAIEPLLDAVATPR